MEHLRTDLHTFFGDGNELLAILLPVSAIDILRLACNLLDKPDIAAEVLLIPRFVAQLANDPNCRIWAKQVEINGMIRGKCQYPIQLINTPAVVNDIAAVRAKTGIARTSDIVRLAIEKLHHDVILQRKPNVMKILNG